MQGGLDLGKPWGTESFLNGGKPAVPIKLETVHVKTTADAIEITLPQELTAGEPQILTFEWGDKIR
jgi:hypothetical protein